MIAIEYHADLKEVQSDAELAALLGDEAQSAPFDRLAWWQGLAEHCQIEPLLAVARIGDARAVLPLRLDHGGLGALANWYTFRFRPVLDGTTGREQLLEGLARDLATRWNRISLTGIPREDGTFDLLRDAFRGEGWYVESMVCDTNHIIRVNNRSYAEYLAARPGQLRTTLKRKGPKLQCQVFTHFDEAAWNDYEAIYQDSWKPAEGSPEFLRQFAGQEGQAGRLRLGIARSDGAPVAAQLWTVEGEVAFIHKLAHRHEARSLSPGSVLSAALFEHVIDRDRVAMVDFGTGDDPYKRDWMEEQRPRYRLDMYRPAHPANWRHIAKSALRRLAAGAKHG